MNSKELKLIKLEKELDPLINKIRYFEGDLFKLTHYSNIYIYGIQYEQDDELIINTDVLFLFYGTYSIYRHFNNNFKKVVNKNKFKIKFSSFVCYNIIDENINDVYFIDNKKYDNYYSSTFYSNQDDIKIKQRYINFFYALFFGPMSTSNEYYLNYRKNEIEKHFKDNINIIDKKELLDELTVEEPLFKMNFYDAYLKLHDEYKTY